MGSNPPAAPEDAVEVTAARPLLECGGGRRRERSGGLTKPAATVAVKKRQTSEPGQEQEPPGGLGHVDRALRVQSAKRMVIYLHLEANRSKRSLDSDESWIGAS